MPGGTIWTKKEAELASKMWKSGKTSRDIAKVTGRTRNAVMGYIYRLGLCKTRTKAVSDKEKKRLKGLALARRRAKQCQYQQAYYARNKQRLSKRPKPKAGKKKFGQKPGKPTPPKPYRLPDYADSRNKSILEVKNGECRFMPGDGKLCCAKPTVGGVGSWCEDHLRLVEMH